MLRALRIHHPDADGADYELHGDLRSPGPGSLLEAVVAEAEMAVTDAEGTDGMSFDERHAEVVKAAWTALLARGTYIDPLGVKWELISR